MRDITTTSLHPGPFALLLALCAGLSWISPARADGPLSPDTTDPALIAHALYRNGVPSSRAGRVKLTITPAGETPRERTMLVRSKSEAVVRKSLLLVEGPADVRGTGFATIEYPGGGQDSTRVAGGQMSGAFLGSDLAFADLSALDPDLFDYKMITQSEDVDGETCWVIEATPKTPKTRDELGYRSADSWVSKAKLAVVRTRATLVADGATKYFQASDFRLVGGTWSPFKVVVRTVKDGKVNSETVADTLEAKIDPSVSDDDFSKHRLEQGP
jgi:Outer membrane lipoprotein-sorting protein